MWAENTWEGMGGGAVEIRFVDWMGVSLDEWQHSAVVTCTEQEVVFAADEVASVQIMRADDTVILVEEE